MCVFIFSNAYPNLCLYLLNVDTIKSNSFTYKPVKACLKIKIYLYNQFNICLKHLSGNIGILCIIVTVPRRWLLQKHKRMSVTDVHVCTCIRQYKYNLYYIVFYNAPRCCGVFIYHKTNSASGNVDHTIVQLFCNWYYYYQLVQRGTTCGEIYSWNRFILRLFKIVLSSFRQHLNIVQSEVYNKDSVFSTDTEEIRNL